MKPLPTKLALVGPAQGVNYGNALTYYALHRVLCDMGYDPLIVLPPLNFWWGESTEWLNWRMRPYEESSICPRFGTKREIAEYFSKQGWCDIYLVGSDQLFNFPSFCEGIESYAYLDWVPDDKRKIAYAASFGNERIFYPKKAWKEARHWIRRFDAFSVREQSAVKLCHDYFRVAATCVPDPVFLCDKRHYEQLADASLQQQRGIVSYFLNQNRDTERDKMVAKVCESYGSKMIEIKDYILMKNECSVEDWLNLVRHARFLMTDSFHGACFAIIFHIPFICLLTPWGGHARIHSLLDMIGLKDRLVTSYEDFLSLACHEIDWEKVDAKLDVECTNARAFLEKMLASSKKTKISVGTRILHDIHYLFVNALYPFLQLGRRSKLRKFFINLLPLSSIRRRWRKKYLQ